MEPQTQLLQQQQAILGYLSRKEMRDCGIWLPMPKIDGTALDPALSTRFPKSPDELKNLSYRDKIALVNAYALPWTEASAQDPAEVLRQFIEGRQPPPPPARSRGGECECWRVTIPVFVAGFVGIMAVISFKLDAAKGR